MYKVLYFFAGNSECRNIPSATKRIKRKTMSLVFTGISMDENVQPEITFIF